MEETKCRKCGGGMHPGVAMGQTAVARRPAHSADEVRTFYAGGTGRLIGCMKCVACGWSVTPPLPKEPAAWGASHVTHPAYIAEQREKNQRARDILDGMDPKEPA